MMVTYLTFEFNRLRHNNRYLKKELAINSDVPIDYLRELYYIDRLYIKNEIVSNSSCPEDLFKDYYSNVPTNKSRMFLKNINIPENYIQFIIDYFLKHELADKRHLECERRIGAGNAMMTWSINNLVECVNITSEQLIEIYNFMEKDESFKKALYYKECLNNVKCRIEYFDEIALKDRT